MDQASTTPSIPGVESEVKVARALLSVSDKTGIVEFACGLAELGIEVVSTGGTLRQLSDAGVPVRPISELTGFPEILDGRVKTLHPKLYAGLLAVRDDPGHLQQAEEHEVEFVDLVCVNLYPFERTAATRGVEEREVIENIDIGGPTMIRAAAKNFRYVAPVVSPESYDAVLAELRESDRTLAPATRQNLAAEAFAYTARYDTAIARWFQERHEDFPPLIARAYEKVLELPYGENPHQRAAYYAQVGARRHVLSMVSQLGGKELSFNNILDLDAARSLLGEFQVPACVIVKHNNPCGVALGSDLLEAYRRAFASDPMSAFGGIVCLNGRVDRKLAEALVGQFIEVLFAPGYADEALEVLSSKPNMRVLDDREQQVLDEPEADLRQVAGGMLVQDPDSGLEDRHEMQVASRRRPTETEWNEALFAWRVCKHVRSNAIVLSRELATVGIGAGQMSRVDSVRIALEKASSPGAGGSPSPGAGGSPSPGAGGSAGAGAGGSAGAGAGGSAGAGAGGLGGRGASRALGAALASDAYFPFADGPQLALDAGVSVIIQPGGSVRDELTIDAVDNVGAAMIFTSRRHFRH